MSQALPRATHNQCYTGRVATLTLSVDPDVLRRARIRALERGESVNKYLAEMLERYANSGARDGIEEFLAFAENCQSGHVGEGRGWTRDELYRV